MKRRKIRRKKFKRHRGFFILSCVFILFLLSVGYGAFQTSVSVNVTGKIKKFLVTFDPNGGITPVQTKYVGSNYGELPTPIREGYTFMGWNGKNLLNLDVDESFPSSTVMSNDTKRTFIPNTYVLGLAFNNYYNRYDLIKSEYSINNDQISFKALAGYGVGFPFKSNEYQNYVLSYNISSTGEGYSSALFYKEDGTLINYVFTKVSGEKQVSFITPKDTYYLVIEFSSESYGGLASNVTVSDIQLELGESATALEPYFITNNSKVIQRKDHTLTAIWKENN